MYGRNNDELQLPMDTQVGFINKLSVADFRAKLNDGETKINGKPPLFVFANHDNPRVLNRYAGGEENPAIAKLIATILLSPRDVALFYYGQELGMTDNPPKRIEDVQDPIGKLGWPKEKGRDGERTPMQWTNGFDAGFSKAQRPWLPINPNYKSINVATEQSKPDSILNYYKKLIALRKDNAQLREGEFALIDPDNTNVLSFIRKTADGKAVLVSCNFTAQSQTLSFDLQSQGIQGKHLRTLAASFANANPADVSHVTLPSHGSYVGQIEP
jgi:alpha-glucosidase